MLKKLLGFNCRGMFGLLRRISKVFWRPKYNGEYLHGVVKENLRDARLNETLTNVVIPTFDIKHLQPAIFSTYEVSPTHTHTHTSL